MWSLNLSLFRRKAAGVSFIRIKKNYKKTIEISLYLEKKIIFPNTSQGYLRPRSFFLYHKFRQFANFRVENRLRWTSSFHKHKPSNEPKIISMCYLNGNGNVRRSVLVDSDEAQDRNAAPPAG